MLRAVAYALAYAAYGLTRCSETLFSWALRVSEQDACDAFHDVTGGR